MMMLKTNEGRIDRTIRMIAGTVLLFKSFGSKNFVCRWSKGLLGTLLLATGAIGFCGLYKLFDFNTLQDDESPKEIL